MDKGKQPLIPQIMQPQEFFEPVQFRPINVDQQTTREHFSGSKSSTIPGPPNMTLNEPQNVGAREDAVGGNT